MGVGYVFFVDKKLRFGLKDLLHTDRQLLRDFIRYGLPVIGGQVVWAINSLANTKILGYYSAGVIAAASITGMLHNLVYVWMNGMSSAVGIITGKTVGAGQYEKMKEYSKTVQMIFSSLWGSSPGRRCSWPGMGSSPCTTPAPRPRRIPGSLST